MNKKLLEVLVCPKTNKPLLYDKNIRALISVEAGLAYPVKDGIPVLLLEEAKVLDDQALVQYRS